MAARKLDAGAVIAGRYGLAEELSEGCGEPTDPDAPQRTLRFAQDDLLLLRDRPHRPQRAPQASHSPN